MELFAYTYAHLWKCPTTVLRFFNVYGPHGRPDMMPWQWTQQILAGEPLMLYGGGKLKPCDWTYIDDIVAGFISAARQKTRLRNPQPRLQPPHRQFGIRENPRESARQNPPS